MDDVGVPRAGGGEQPAAVRPGDDVGDRVDRLDAGHRRGRRHDNRGLDGRPRRPQELAARHVHPVLPQPDADHLRAERVVPVRVALPQRLHRRRAVRRRPDDGRRNRRRQVSIDRRVSESPNSTRPSFRPQSPRHALHDPRGLLQRRRPARLRVRPLPRLRRDAAHFARLPDHLPRRVLVHARDAVLLDEAGPHGRGREVAAILPQPGREDRGGGQELRVRAEQAQVRGHREHKTDERCGRQQIDARRLR